MESHEVFMMISSLVFSLVITIKSQKTLVIEKSLTVMGDFTGCSGAQVSGSSVVVAGPCSIASIAVM